MVVGSSNLGAGVSLTPTNSTLGTAAIAFGTTNLFVIPAGTTVTLEIRADLTQTSDSGIGSVKAEFTSGSYIGVSSSQAASTGVVTGEPTLTVIAGNLTIGANFNNQNGSANTNHVKIGSYILQAGNAEAVRITNLAVGLTGTASSTGLWTNISNLITSENTTPVSPQVTNNFPVNITLAANTTKTIDIFTDIGNVTTGQNIIASLTVTANGVNTNNSVGGSKTGGTLTIQSGVLQTPTLVTNAPNAQLVTPGTFVAASYKFVATSTTATVSEMTFNVFNTATTSLETSAVQSVTVGGVTSAVVEGVATLTGLNLSVPAGITGLTVPVTVTYNAVTSAGLGGATTRTPVGLNLVFYKATVSNVTTPTTLAAGVPSNTMILVASTPTVALAADNTAAVANGYVGGPNKEVMRFTVTAPTGGTVNLKAIGFTPTYVGLTAATQAITVFDKDDMTTALGTAQIGATGVQGTVAFTSDYIVTGTKEFVVKVDTSGIGADGESFQLSLTSGDTAISTGTNWQWNDGTAATYGNGFLLKVLPVDGNTFNN